MVAARKTAKPGKELVRLHDAADLNTPAKREAVASKLADDMLAAIDKDREAAGLPPLK